MSSDDTLTFAWHLTSAAVRLEPGFRGGLTPQTSVWPGLSDWSNLLEPADDDFTICLVFNGFGLLELELVWTLKKPSIPQLAQVVSPCLRIYLILNGEQMQGQSFFQTLAFVYLFMNKQSAVKAVTGLFTLPFGL